MINSMLPLGLYVLVICSMIAGNLHDERRGNTVKHQNPREWDKEESIMSRFGGANSNDDSVRMNGFKIVEVDLAGLQCDEESGECPIEESMLDPALRRLMDPSKYLIISPGEGGDEYYDDEEDDEEATTDPTKKWKN